jgi:biopolymer transport protein ExbD
VQKEQIPGVLKQMIGDNKDVTVELAIDENVPHKYFVELVDIISVQNAYKIGIQTRPQK